MSDIKVGAVGPRGESGERGERGERGHRGPTGPTGPVGAGPWLTTDTAVHTINFDAVDGFLHQLGGGLKLVSMLLPLAASVGPSGRVAAVVVAPTTGWSVVANGADTIDGTLFGQTYPLVGGQGEYVIFLSDGISNWSVISAGVPPG